MMEQMKETMQTLLSENKSLRRDQEKLTARIVDLENELIHMRSSSKSMETDRSKNVIVVGLTDDDNCQVNIMKTFDALNVNVSQEDFTYKVLPSKSNIKPVLVSFTGQNLRDTVLKCRKSTTLNTEICKIPTEQKRNIYINPDLSKHIRELFLKAKELKSHGFKYVWCKDDSILARKNDGDPVTRIITSAQIQSIINK